MPADCVLIVWRPPRHARRYADFLEELTDCPPHCMLIASLIACRYADFLEGFEPEEPEVEEVGSGDEFYTGADDEPE